MEKRDFKRCQICETLMEKIEFDSPIYCGKCIAEMEKKGLTPEELAKRRRR